MNRIKLILLAGAFVGLAGCNQDAMEPVAGGTSDDTHTSISLTGRVFDEQSKPLGAVIARLRQRGIADTTQGDGRYTLKGELPALAGRTMSSLDTIDLLRNGTVLHSIPVTAWVDTLPDVFLVHRDISGAILPGDIRVASVVVVLETSLGDTLNMNVEWNASSERYSGFAWSEFTGGLDTFYVRARALDSAGHVVGTSMRLRFTSIAGDIVLPAFTMGNALPQVSLTAPLVLQRGQQARIRSTIVDSLGLPKTIHWKIGDGPWGTGAAESLYTIPLDQKSSQALVRIRLDRADGLSASDSVVIGVSGLEPIATIEGDDATIYPWQPFKIRMHDSLVGGTRIVKRWIGAQWNVEVSGSDTTLTAPGTYDSTFMVTYTVTDDYGRSTTDTLLRPLVPSFLPGLKTSAGPTWIDFSWGKMAPSWTHPMEELTVAMTDGTVGQSGFQMTVTRLHDILGTVDRDSLRYKVHRQTAANVVRVKLSRRKDGYGWWSENAGLSDSSYELSLPPLVWDFEGNMVPRSDPTIMNDMPILCGESYTRSFCTTEPTIHYDPVFKSQALEVPYRRADDTEVNDHLGDSSQVFGVVTGWKGIKALSMKVRGTPATAWLWLDTHFRYQTSTPAYPLYPVAFEELRAKGITLGWEVRIDSTGGVQRFSVADMRWSDGVERSSPSASEILEAAVGFKFLFKGEPGTLILDDIHFER